MRWNSPLSHSQSECLRRASIVTADTRLKILAWHYWVNFIAYLILRYNSPAYWVAAVDTIVSMIPLPSLVCNCIWPIHSCAFRCTMVVCFSEVMLSLLTYILIIGWSQGTKRQILRRRVSWLSILHIQSIWSLCYQWVWRSPLCRMDEWNTISFAWYDSGTSSSPTDMKSGGTAASGRGESQSHNGWGIKWPGMFESI
jgi:hypothetical protein